MRPKKLNQIKRTEIGPKNQIYLVDSDSTRKLVSIWISLNIGTVIVYAI